MSKGIMITRLVSEKIKTPLGEMLAIATEKGLCLFKYMDDATRLEKFIEQIKKYYGSDIVFSSSPVIEQLKAELDEYFLSQRHYFDTPLDYQGSDFQKQSWQALLDIPYGKTLTYSEQAANMKQPKAIRAVAQANNRNRLSILIPCHRVLGKDGSLTGYGGGLWRKKFLLDLESD